jgi:2,3-bisphosphoglycerate-independent phosphoglycerate mutase
MGIELAPDEVALRLNLVHIASDVMVSYACGHISTPESRGIVTELASVLDDDTFRLYPGVAYRHILVVKGAPEVLDGTYMPPHDISDKPASPHLPSGPGSDLLRAYMERARAALEVSEANRRRAESGGLRATDVWPFWPGVRPGGLVPFSERRGIKAAMTSGVDLLNGLAVLAGIDRLVIEGVTDGSDTDYAAQAAGALAALEDHDLVVIHVESPDEEGHAGSVSGKRSAIEAIDRHVVTAVRSCAEELRILAMPDHPTPVELKTHVGESVPFVLWGPGILSNGASAYGEGAAASTGLVVDPGRGVMDLLLAP